MSDEGSDDALRELEDELARLGGRGPERDRLEGYELLEEVSRGGQGVVHRALQRSTKRQVAVKLLHDAAFASPRHLRRFEREVEVVADLQHPNIATVHDGGISADGRPFLVLEWIDGVPADGRLRRPGSGDEATTTELLELFVKICRAVQHAHQRGVLHRDLKPANILVDAQGEPHVLDFGMAAVEGDPEAARLTRTGEFVGTLAYAAPEQVSGVPGDVDVRTDVYALGLILYELLTGRAPYPAEGAMAQVVRAICEDAPRPPSHWRRVDSRSGALTEALAGVGADLDLIVLSALAKDKARRYPDAGALADDVERYLAGEPIRARADSTLYVLRKALARHRLGAAATALILLALVGATGVSLVFTARAQVQAAKAEEISGVLGGLLLSISPDQARGHSVTVREVLDETARKLDDAPPSSPEVELELRSLVGRTYLLLSLPADAERHLARAAELVSEAHGPRSPALAELLALRSAVRNQLGRFAEAEADARAGLAVLAGLGRRADPQVRIELQTALAHTLTLVGRDGEAESLIEQASASVDTTEAGWHAELLRQRGLLLLRRGSPEVAVGVLDRALALVEASELGPGRAASIERRLGEALLAAGRDAEGLVLQAEARAAHERLLGAGHPWTILSRIAEASARARVQGLPAIEGELAELLALRGHLARQRDATGAEALNDLGILASDAGRYVEAEECLRAAVELYDALYDTSSYERALARGNLGWCLLWLGRAQEARELIAEARAIVSRLGGAGSAQEAIYHQQLGWVLLLLEGPAPALVELEAALDLFRARLPAGHRYEQETLADLGLVESLAGRPAEAEQHLREALRLIDEHGGLAVLEGKALQRLTYLLMDSGRLDEALSGAERAVELHRATLPPRHPELAETLNALAMTLVKRVERLEEARALLEEALAIAEAQGPDYARTTFLLGNMGTLVFIVDRDPEGAAEWFQRALEHGERTGAERLPTFAFVLANRAFLHQLARQPEQAIPLLERALTTFEAVGHPFAVRVREALVQACEDAGDAERSERHRAGGGG